MVRAIREEEERFVTMTTPERVLVTNQLFDRLGLFNKRFLVGSITRTCAMTVPVTFLIRVS
jgi:hypothetical protein